jgi:sugar lactone lactonase YvrE
MKPQPSLHLAVAMTLATLGWLVTTGCGPANSASENSMMAVNQSEAAAEKARASDPAWKPACREVAVIQVGEKGKGGGLHNYCLDREGNILACCGGDYVRYEMEPGKETAKEVAVKVPAEIQIYSPEGKKLNSWPMPTKPQAICVHTDGTVFVGGGGKVHKLNATGKVLASIPSPTLAMAVPNQSAATSDQEALNRQKYLEQRKQDITGMAVTDQDVFVACPSTTDFSFCVFRLDHQLQNPKLIVKGLRGCCGQMDIQARDGKLWIPHNAKHRVECFDREGKELASFGRTDRKAADGFGGCCEPKNLRLLPSGEILAAESGPPTCIKRFSPEGKFLGVVGLPNFKSDCVRVSVEASADGKRYYILNTGDDAIHVLATKG